MAVRERLARRGVWCATELLPAAEAAALATEIEGLGYSALWLPEAMGRDPFAHIAHLAGSTSTLVLGTGIATIHHRHPGAMQSAAMTVAEQSGGRFVLGLGVSHGPMVEGILHRPYERPLATMRTYLEQMDNAPYLGAQPAEPPLRVLAALGPKMIELAGERADGTLSYWTTPDHTADARKRLGPDGLLCVEQKVVLTDDAAVARETASQALGIYAGLPNYRNCWLRLGFTDDQIDGRDPAFLDALVAWGDVEAITARLDEHVEAGADHVCIQPLPPGQAFGVDRAALQALAPTPETAR